jgi:hypothetical protein
LYQDAIDIIAGVQLVNDGQQLVRGDGFRRRIFVGAHAQILARFHLGADINFGCGIVAHQDGGQAGRTPGSGTGGDARPQLFFDLVANAKAVKDRGHG